MVSDQGWRPRVARLLSDPEEPREEKNFLFLTKENQSNRAIGWKTGHCSLHNFK